MATNDRFGGASWSLRLALAWQGQHDEECATITDDAGIGALQISAVLKQNEAVSDDDLREFAEGLPDPVRAVSFGAFAGFEHAFTENGFSWRRWFLRSESILLFATYNCYLIDAGTGDLDVEMMLQSLRRIGPQ